MSSPETPMMKQYLQIKAAHPGFLLFYRMGDFYELFGEDALIASDILQITLTQRRSKKDEEGTPMCGVPFHAAEGYIAKLLKAGRKIALCEQTETPEQAKARGGYKALVKREVTRLYTQGTLTEENLLESDRHNFLACFATVGADHALAWLDLSTGEFFVQAIAIENLAHSLVQVHPQELLLDETTSKDHAIALAPFAPKLTVHNPLLATDQAEKTLMDIGIEEKFPTKATLRAAGALVDYVRLTQIGKMPQIASPRIMSAKETMQIDASTRTNLELTQTLKGETRGSLLHAINRTVTAAGSRLLARWLNAPLMNKGQIETRQTAIIELLKNTKKRHNVVEHLKQTTDMARCLSRITLERGGPRDLANLHATLRQLPDIISTLNQCQATGLQDLAQKMQGFDDLCALLASALDLENLPLLARDGGFIRAEYCPKLAEFKDLTTNGRQKLTELERAEAERTGISSLRIKYNKVWGYYIEITKSNLKSGTPEDYIHRQTTTNAQRFSTAELMDLEQKLSAAEHNALTRELEIFHHLCSQVSARADDLLTAAEAVATLDVLCAGAQLAAQEEYVCPEITTGTDFYVQAGRHPVVTQLVESFVPNDADLSGGKLWLITGPNMAGKSTFLRQNALICILAQIGYFVPAKGAKIGLVDRIFTRIGAADDLARGQSTFMVEMVETATILNEATPQSLVILDEIGRGTATYDGLAIAWACVEHLLTQTRCRGLFATHYHELTGLTDTFNSLQTHHVTVKEWQGDIVFLHKVALGAAPRSYGVHVAKLAGLPASAVKRAEDILQGLEKASKGKKAANAQDLPLFTSPSQPIIQPESQKSEVESTVSELNLDDLTPRQAQDMLYQLKHMLKA